MRTGISEQNMSLRLYGIHKVQRSEALAREIKEISTLAEQAGLPRKSGLSPTVKLSALGHAPQSPWLLIVDEKGLMVVGIRLSTGSDLVIKLVRIRSHYATI